MDGRHIHASYSVAIVSFSMRTNRSPFTMRASRVIVVVVASVIIFSYIGILSYYLSGSKESESTRNQQLRDKINNLKAEYTQLEWLGNVLRENPQGYNDPVVRTALNMGLPAPTENELTSASEIPQLLNLQRSDQSLGLASSHKASPDTVVSTHTGNDATSRLNCHHSSLQYNLIFQRMYQLTIIPVYWLWAARTGLGHDAWSSCCVSWESSL